jgi:hypothetical protein
MLAEQEALAGWHRRKTVGGGMENEKLKRTALFSFN